MRTSVALFMCSALVGSVATASTAIAQAPSTPANITVGAPIYDAKGGDVGTVDSIVGDNVVVSTGSQKVTLSKAAFAQWPKGLTIAMTRDELNAAADQAKAQNAQALTDALAAGTDVHGSGGAKVGVIKSVEGDQVLVTTPKGDVSIPKNSFAMGASGLSIGLSAEQFEAAVAQATKPAA
ncbi:hypothetical protein [Sphingobium sp. CR28]|uniref:hypothetical protein n=1 Tax=Sphingobium sp. CR28 TaxID=3400272 RepID=UPI003FEE261F